MSRLEGKVALVTGASRGIGRAVALKLAQEGAHVVVNYSAHQEAAEDVVGRIKQQGSDAIALSADMSDVSQIERLVNQTVEHYGKLDILVSNAGVEFFKALEETTPEEFDHVFGINTRGQFFVMQQAAKYMTQGGRIIATSSVSVKMGLAGHAIYAGSKVAVEIFVRNLAAELGPRGITVNAIVPGATDTDMAAENSHHYVPANASLSAHEQVSKMVPLGRYGQPEDIANVIAFLVSDEGSWITGQAIHATGGM